MELRFVLSISFLLILVNCASGCQARQNVNQKVPTTADTPRALPPVGPYFHELAERAKKTGHVYDRFELFREIDEVLSAPGGSAVPGCNKDSPPTPAGGYDSWEHAHKDLRTLFEKGDAHAGYLLNSQTPTLFFSWEMARKRGNPYATLAILRVRSGVGKRTSDETKEAEEAISKLVAMAEKGDREAMYELAGCATFGKERADRWYEKLKEQPDRLTYKAMYYRGASGGIPHNGALVLEAAEHGEARAMSRLAEHYYYGSEPFTGLAMKDLEKAWYWLRKFREAVGCPSPEEAPPIDMDTGNPWKKPKPKPPVRKR